MSDTIKLRDKVTGEIITLRMKDTSPKSEKKAVASDKPVGIGAIDERSEKFKKEIASRGSLGGEIAGNLKSPNIMRKGMGVLGVMDAPRRAIEAGFANPALAMQAGNFNPMDLAREFKQGITGQKLGQYGDVMEIAGLPKPVSATTGLLLSSAPGKLIQMAKRGFGQIAKLSDKGMTKAGSSLIKSTEEATKFVGSKVDEAYASISSTPVDVGSVKRVFNELPETLGNLIKKEFGIDKIDDITELNMGQLRQFKQLVGKYRTSAFGRDARGVADNIDSEKINSAYGMLKKIIYSTTEQAHGKKIADSITKADKAFSEVSKASDYIKKTIVDPTLLKPTKVGAMAKKFIAESDMSGRDALNTVRNSSRTARREIDRAVSELEKFNRWMGLSAIGQHAAGAAFYGGAIGGIGGYAASKVYNRNAE